LIGPLKKLTVFTALWLTLPAVSQAGDALTQSLEQTTSKGTVADRQEPVPSPVPTANPNVISDKAAAKKIHYRGRTSKGRRAAPTPVPAPK
jgi:hypothetical protein